MIFALIILIPGIVIKFLIGRYFFRFLSNSSLYFSFSLSKRERGGGDQILGSTALFGSVDAVLLIDRQKAKRTFHTIMRYGNDWPLSELTFLDETKKLILIAHEEMDLDAEMRTNIETFVRRKQTPQSEKEIDAGISGREDACDNF